jgi:hypothetical protein
MLHNNDRQRDNTAGWNIYPHVQERLERRLQQWCYEREQRNTCMQQTCRYIMGRHGEDAHRRNMEKGMACAQQ